MNESWIKSLHSGFIDTEQDDEISIEEDLWKEDL